MTATRARPEHPPAVGRTVHVPTGPAHRRPRRPRLLATFGLLALMDVAFSLPQLLAARVLALALVVYVTGSVVVCAARLRLASPCARWAATAGAGLAVVMAWAAIGSTVLPYFGVARPISRLPLAVALNLIVVGIAALCPAGADPVLGPFRARGSLRLRLWHAVWLLPALSAVGVERLNDGHGSALVQVTMGGAGLAFLLGLAFARRGFNGRAQACLYCAGLAALYLYSFRGNRLFGYDVQQEYQRYTYVLTAGRWTPPSNGDPYSAMLSITALPAALTKLTSVSGLYLFKGLYPMFVALVPPLVYEMAMWWAPATGAFVGAVYMIVLPDFAEQLPALARQEIAFLYFTLLVYVLFMPGARSRRRQVVVACLLAALVVSHYSTSYVAVVMLGSTWAVFAVFRLIGRTRRRGRTATVPAISLVTVLLGVLFVVGWDVGITNSSGNVTSFVSSLADKGVAFLPYNKGGTVINRYLNGNVFGNMTPAQYYAAVDQAARASEPWLHPFPSSLADQYPAQPAPGALDVRAIVPGSLGTVSTLNTVFDEALLALIVLGALVAFFRRRRGPPRAPLEVALFGLAFVGFLALIRVSGTVAGSYNADRAQLQAAIVLAFALGLSVEWFIRHLRILGTVVICAALLLMFFYGMGESVVLTGGDAPVLLANGGTAYDYFVISEGEVSAAQWMVANAGRSPVIYTDDYGVLRIWDATGYAPAPHTWLTPGALDQGAWVYAPSYAVVDQRAYGSINGATTKYRFPTAFLHRVDNLVYSDPTAQVYQ